LPQSATTDAARGLFIGALLILVSAAPATCLAAVYPLQVGANGRYLVDQNNVPYLIMGDSPQALVVKMSEAEAESYFANRQAYGFNSLWINLLCNTYTGGPEDGSMIDGTQPFSSVVIPMLPYYDLQTPNEDYFAHVDRILEMAASHGLQVFLDPIETGGWLPTMIANGETRCRNYGRYLGNRYKDFDNILWMSGNDFQSWMIPNYDAVVREVARGILDIDTRHLHTLGLNYRVSSSLDDPTWTGIIDLNATYTYFPTYARLRHDYNRINFLPNFMVEAGYESESASTYDLRKQEYWTMTSGATGQLFGNHYVWQVIPGWQQNLDTPGVIQFSHANRFFAQRAWYDLVPDTTHVLVTAGYGAYDDSGSVADNDYLTAAGTPDGDLVLAYTPIVRTFTVDLARLSAPATARWFDTSNGSYSAIPFSPLPNTGLAAFTPPGVNSDGDGSWVLVLETEPPEQPPVVTMTTPAPYATVSFAVPLAALATDHVGVVGVQFQVDGANLGAEDVTPPYTESWDSSAFANGLHIVKAIARDLAGSVGKDSVSVLVANVVPPPPTDHLAAAYAFDATGGTTTVDMSGNGNTGTLHGATFAAGLHGNALVFDGINDYVEMPNSQSLDVGGTGLTVAFWARINSTGSGVDYAVVGKPWFPTTMASPFYQYAVQYFNSSDKALGFYFGDPLAALHGPFRMTPTAGVWTHVAFTYDGDSVRGYLNGVQRLVVADASSVQPRGNSLRLGVNGAYQQSFNGALDDLRIYSRALTAADILNAMLTPVGGSAVDAGADTPHGHQGVTLTTVGPNPFRDITRVGFVLPATIPSELQVIDVSGRLVRTLASGTLAAGRHSVEWNGTDGRGHGVAAGRYFLRLRAGGFEKTASILLVR
jgi:hypothetical protein